MKTNYINLKELADKLKVDYNKAYAYVIVHETVPCLRGDKTILIHEKYIPKLIDELITKPKNYTSISKLARMYGVKRGSIMSQITRLGISIEIVKRYQSVSNKEAKEIIFAINSKKQKAERRFNRVEDSKEKKKIDYSKIVPLPSTKDEQEQFKKALIDLRKNIIIPSYFSDSGKNLIINRLKALKIKFKITRLKLFGVDWEVISVSKENAEYVNRYRDSFFNSY